MKKGGIQQARIRTKKCCQAHSKYTVAKSERLKKKISITKVGHYQTRGFKTFFKGHFPSVLQNCETVVTELLYHRCFSTPFCSFCGKISEECWSWVPLKIHCSTISYSSSFKTGNSTKTILKNIIHFVFPNTSNIFFQ